MMKENCYYYRAKVVSVYDGDTCRVDIDLGFGIWKKEEVLRLHRINAPEIRGETRVEGLQSRDFLREMILDKEIMVQSVKDRTGKYGRYLAEIWLYHSSTGQWQNINDLLVEKGLAIYQEY